MKVWEVRPDESLPDIAQGWALAETEQDALAMVRQVSPNSIASEAGLVMLDLPVDGFNRFSWATGGSNRRHKADLQASGLLSLLFLNW